MESTWRVLQAYPRFRHRSAVPSMQRADPDPGPVRWQRRRVPVVPRAHGRRPGRVTTSAPIMLTLITGRPITP